MSLQAPSSSSKKIDDNDTNVDRYNPLAVFQYLPAPPRVLATLNRLNALLSTQAGVDRSLMLVQYGSPLISLLILKISALKRSLAAAGGTHHWQHVKAAAATSAAATAAGASSRSQAIVNGLKIISSKCSEARMLGRFFGLFPIISWIYSLENKETQPKDAKMRNVQRLQAWSMLAYYPLEHLYYLSAQGVINLSATKRLQAILWACRAWGVYVFLQLFIYSEQARSLSARMKLIAQKRAQLSRQPGHSASDAANRLATAAAHEKEKDQSNVNTDELVEQAGGAVEEAAIIMNEREVLQQGRALLNGAMTTLAYAPLTVHWSLPQGIFKNEIWSSVFMTIAAVSGLHANWLALKK